MIPFNRWVIKVFLWLDKFSFNKKLLSPLYKHRILVNRFYLTFICLMYICIPNYIFYLSWYLKRKENNWKNYSQLYIIDDTSIFWMNIFIVLIVIYLVKFKDDIIPSDPLTLEKKSYYALFLDIASYFILLAINFIFLFFFLVYIGIFYMMFIR